MKKRAILYTRVGTHEKTKSKHNSEIQYQQLLNYCELNNIEIVNHFADNHSAKTFNRPGFKQLLAYAEENQNKIDYLLIVTWDRFSRNGLEAYPMLERLKEWNIETNAITQSTDNKVSFDQLMYSKSFQLRKIRWKNWIMN